jgi:hypothetical protein
VDEAVEKVENAEEAEEAIVNLPLPPQSAAPAAIQVSRAGRKRAPTMKALEAEKLPKRDTEQVRSRGRGRRGRAARK